MQFIDYTKCSSIESIEREISAMSGKRLITPEQAESVSAKKILDFFNSPLGKRVLNADNVYREFKYSILAPGELIDTEWAQEQILFQGVVDCCIEERGELTIIDFKTDIVTEKTVDGRAMEYQPQLMAYEYAVERIMGKKAAEKYLYFFHTGTAVKL